MQCKTSISIKEINKNFKIYKNAKHRLLGLFFPRLKNLFEEFSALRDISLEIERGEIVGIIGKNGSGKSTLLQLICRTLEPTSGEIQYEGRLAAMLELGSGFNPDFTGRENIYFNAAIIGLSKKEVDLKIDSIINFSEIGKFIDLPCRTYSSGMYMRLAFAVQAHIDPDILIIDEALAVGDAAFVRKCMAHFQSLKKKGVTILFVSHDSTAIKLLCDRAIWLKNGTVVSYGDAREVVDKYLIDIDDSIAKNLVYDPSYGFGNVEKSKYNINILKNKKGSLKAIIYRAGLVNSNLKAINTLKTGEDITILLEIHNYSLPCCTRINCGYVLKNNRGIDISSGNSKDENFFIVLKNIGDTIYYCIKFTSPHLHSGYYTIDLSLNSEEEFGVSECLDLSENSIDFNLEATINCHAIMAIKTEYSRML